MPHQCTTCGHVFDDGSKEMLEGCPDCGNNTFQFHADDPPEEPTADDRPKTPDSRVGRAAGAVRERVGGADWPDWPGDGDTGAPPGDDIPSGADSATDPETDPGENSAQADARAAVVDRDAVPEESSRDQAHAGDDEGNGGETDLSALREELDDQFESIRILEPGQYELNLMELYNRQEQIVALQEDGRYVIEVPEAHGGPPGEGN